MDTPDHDMCFRHGMFGYARGFVWRMPYTVGLFTRNTAGVEHRVTHTVQEQNMLSRFKSLGLGTRIITTTLVILVSVVAVNYIVFVNKYKHSAEEAMVERAAAFTAVADEAKNHVADLNTSGVFDTPTLLEDLKKDLASGKSYSETRVFGTIPVVAGWTAAQAAAERENIDFRVSAYEARNKENEPSRDSFEGKLLTDLTAQVKAGGEEVIHRIDEATN